MPKGKNAGYRYRLIDLALRNTARRWTWEGLLDFLCQKLEEEFDVNLNGEKERALSLRQLADDIRIMRKDPPEGFGAPIIRKEGYIYYGDPGFSINDNPLINSDIERLKEVLRLIRPYQSLPQLHDLETIIGKVQGTISRSVGDQIIELEHNPNVKGLSHIESLYPLIREERKLLITYRPFNREKAIEYLMHPFLIKEFNNRWFLLGWLPEEVRYIVLGLDRIISWSPVDGQIDSGRKTELLRLQKSLIGVSIKENVSPVRVLLLFSPDQAPYIITKPLHPSQKLIAKQPEGIVVSLDVVHNFELEQTLLTFGERVKVLEPEHLREVIISRLRKALDNY